MCDYSLHHVASRRAKVGDKLVTTELAKSSTRGFAAVGEHGAKLVIHDGPPKVAVCLLPGTELAFHDNVRYDRAFSLFGKARVNHKVARFRQIDTNDPHVQHDDRGSSGAAGLVGCPRGDTRGDGIHGWVLESGVLRLGGRLHGVAGECATHEERPRAQDRRLGLRLDRTAFGARAVAGQLRTTRTNPGASGSDAVSQEPASGTRARGESTPQGAGGCRGEVGCGGQRRAGRLGPRDGSARAPSANEGSQGVGTC